MARTEQRLTTHGLNVRGLHYFIGFLGTEVSTQLWNDGIRGAMKHQKPPARLTMRQLLAVIIRG